jgi:protein-tyrosine phosphatase
MPPATGTSLPAPRDPSAPYRICCVCLGNICRSPMAEAVLRRQLAKAGLATKVIVDSAGTGDWHVGERMYHGARAQLAREGYDSESHRARRFDRAWLADRDLILAMDSGNLRDLRDLARRTGHPANPDQRIRLFGEIANLGGADVPDPYGGTPADFAHVLTMLETGMATLVAQLSALLATQPSDPTG